MAPPIVKPANQPISPLFIISFNHGLPVNREITPTTPTKASTSKNPQIPPAIAPGIAAVDPTIAPWPASCASPAAPLGGIGGGKDGFVACGFTKIQRQKLQRHAGIPKNRVPMKIPAIVAETISTPGEFPGARVFCITLTVELTMPIAAPIIPHHRTFRHIRASKVVFI
jgi:hypothetical protein